MSEFTDGTTKFIVTQSLGVLPGTITAFSGAFKDGYPIDKNTGRVDREWHLCDGTNGTPDLRNRFIYGGDGTNNGATGGEESHTLNVEELPERTVVSLNANGLKIASVPWNTETYPTWGATSLHDYKVGGLSTNYNQPHNNMPPYYMLAFIMKL